MKMIDIEEIDKIAQSADFIVNGFAYICRDEIVRVINLNDTTRTAVLDRAGNILQTNMYDIEVSVVQAYWEKNKQVVE